MADISNLGAALGSLSFEEAFPVLKTIAIFAIGLLFYSIFIFKFYRFVAKRDIFELNLQQYSTSKNASLKKTGSVLFYILEYLIIFPLITLFWFGILFMLMIFLAKNQPIESILLTAMAIVAIVRATSYYNEDLSKDLAKILPFTLLGLFLIDASYFSPLSSIELMSQVPLHIKSIVYYFVFIVIVEFFFRIGHGIASLLGYEKDEDD